MSLPLSEGLELDQDRSCERVRSDAHDLADGFSGTSGRRNDVGSSATSTTPVLGRRTVNGLLGRSGSVDGGHEGFDDTELVVDDLG